MAQYRYFETGLGAKYDKFTIQQSERAFSGNVDLGAIAFISFGQLYVDKKLSWEAGLATNNYKLNFKVTSPGGEIFSDRELVAVMRSNRLFVNINHNTKSISEKFTWVNGVGISVLIGAKNPYDVILQRGKEIETSSGTQSVNITIKTYGKTGSGILIGASSRLYYQIKNDFRLVTNLAMITAMSELTKVDVNYVFDSSPTYKKAVFTSNGFAPFLTLGLQYIWKYEK